MLACRGEFRKRGESRAVECPDVFEGVRLAREGLRRGKLMGRVLTKLWSSILLRIAWRSLRGASTRRDASNDASRRVQGSRFCCTVPLAHYLDHSQIDGGLFQDALIAASFAEPAVGLMRVTADPRQESSSSRSNLTGGC